MPITRKIGFYSLVLFKKPDKLERVDSEKLKKVFSYIDSLSKTDRRREKADC